MHIKKKKIARRKREGGNRKYLNLRTLCNSRITNSRESALPRAQEQSAQHPLIQSFLPSALSFLFFHQQHLQFECLYIYTWWGFFSPPRQFYSPNFSHFFIPLSQIYRWTHWKRRIPFLLPFSLLTLIFSFQDMFFSPSPQHVNSIDPLKNDNFVDLNKRWSNNFHFDIHFAFNSARIKKKTFFVRTYQLCYFSPQNNVLPINISWTI